MHHTKGKWEVVPEQIKEGQMTFTLENFVSSYGEARANANLMEQAPAMLEALESCHGSLIDHRNNCLGLMKKFQKAGYEVVEQEKRLILLEKLIKINAEIINKARKGEE